MVCDVLLTVGVYINKKNIYTTSCRFRWCKKNTTMQLTYTPERWKIDEWVCHFEEYLRNIYICVYFQHMVDKKKKKICGPAVFSLWDSSQFKPSISDGQPFLKVVKHKDGWNLIIGFCFLTFKDGTFLHPRDAMCIYIYLSIYIGALYYFTIKWLR